MTTLTLAPPNLVDGQPFDMLGDALLYLRFKYKHHSDIVKLGGLIIEGTNAWRPAIEQRLKELLDDLGNCPLDSWMGAKHAIGHGPRIASCPNSGCLKDAYAGKPAICLAAGPTAAQHMERIAALQSTHVIFTCDSLLDGCLRHGITPDYVCMIEREQRMAQFVTQGGCGSYLLAPPVIHPDCAKPFGDRVLWWWGADELYHWLGDVPRAAMGRSAGTLSVSAALWAGCNPIFLVGHDLSYAMGQTHTADTHAFAREIQKVDDARDPKGNYYLDQFPVERNGGGTVLSNGLWSIFRGDIEAMIAQYPDRRVYNVNHYDGARIKGAMNGYLRPSEAGKEAQKQPISWSKSYLIDPKERIHGLLADIEGIQMHCIRAMELLKNAPKQADLDALAEALAISKLVSEANVWLFRYVTRPLYNAMMLRLHLRASQGRKDLAATIITQCTLVESLFKVGARMRKDLQCLND